MATITTSDDPRLSGLEPRDIQEDDIDPCFDCAMRETHCADAPCTPWERLDGVRLGRSIIWVEVP